MGEQVIMGCLHVLDLGMVLSKAMISTFQFWLVFFDEFYERRGRGLPLHTARKFLAGTMVLIAAVSYRL